MRVQRAFAFIDLSGFTAYTATAGDSRAVDVLTGFRAAVRTVCSRRGVRIAKWLGDGAMLVAVDPTALVSAVLELQRTCVTEPDALALRCGASKGPVILLEGDDYIGHAVNVAARLCDGAVGGEALAAAALSEDLPAWAAPPAEEQVVLRGLDRPLVIVRLGLAGGERPDPVCGIPLVAATAAAERAGADGGDPVLFCSESCLETWESDPAR